MILEISNQLSFYFLKLLNFDMASDVSFYSKYFISLLALMLGIKQINLCSVRYRLKNAVFIIIITI